MRWLASVFVLSLAGWALAQESQEPQDIEDLDARPPVLPFEPKAPGIVTDLPGVLKEIGKTPTPIKLKETPAAWVIPVTVASQKLELQIFRKPDSKVVWLLLKLKKLKSPQSMTKDNLMRMFILNQKYEPASFSYDLEGKRFQIDYAMDARDWSPEMAKWAIGRMTQMAASTRTVWDDSLPAKTPR